MKKQTVLLLGLFCIVSIPSVLIAQINIGGNPVSFRTKLNSFVETQTMPPLDLAAIAREDVQDEQSGLPPRFGYPIDAGYTLENSGQWETLPDSSKIWRLAIYCPGAKSINLLYDSFWLPQGATLYMYNEAKTHVIGGFTSRNNNSPRGKSIGYGTGLIFGDKIILEYHEPADVDAPAELSIAKVVHGYRYMPFGDSGDCQVNINCPDGNNWQLEKTGVALILIGGIRQCTGMLLNNVSEDFTPYFLTANHCLAGLDAVANPNAANWTFAWDYESPTCANPTFEPDMMTTTTGAILVANKGDSDFALFRLTEDPLLDVGLALLYNGWTTGDPGSGGAGIHHPSGDIKKISLHQQIPVDNSTESCLPANVWGVIFEHPDGSFSSTEPGSSGSPLFDENHRVIGQLWNGVNPTDCTGGPTCSDPGKDMSYYGKFSVSWDDTAATRRLKDWLEPTCHDNLTVSTDITIGAPTFYASETLDSDSEISGAVSYVVFNGGSEVVLKDGFEVRAGANFIARNFNCSGSDKGGGSVANGITSDYRSWPALSSDRHASVEEANSRSAQAGNKSSTDKGGYNLTVYPNPVSTTATISYEIRTSAIVNLTIVEPRGSVVAILENDVIKDAGVYTIPWNSGDKNLPSGIYYCILRTDRSVESVRLIATNF